MEYIGVEITRLNAANAASRLASVAYAARSAHITLSLRPDGSLDIGGPLDASGAVVDAIEASAWVWRILLLGTHHVAPCHLCHEWTFVAKGNAPKCRMTPHCRGQHRPIDLLAALNGLGGPPPTSWL